MQDVIPPRPSPLSPPSYPFSPVHVSQHTSSHTAEPRSDRRTPAPLPALPAPQTPQPAPQPAPPLARLLRILIADDNPVIRAGLTALLSGHPDLHVIAEATDGRQALAAAQQYRPDVVLLDVRMPGVDGISVLPYLVRVAPVMMLTYSRENEIVQAALRLGASGYLVHGEFTAAQLTDAIHDITQGRPHFTASAHNVLLEHLRQTSVPYAHGVDARPNLSQQANALPSQGSSVSDLLQMHHDSSHVQRHMGQSPEERRHGKPSTPSTDPAPERESYRLSSREVEVMNLIASGLSNQQIAATCFISEKTVKNHINRIFAKLRSGSRSEAIAIWLGLGGRSGCGQHT